MNKALFQLFKRFTGQFLPVFTLAMQASGFAKISQTLTTAAPAIAATASLVLLDNTAQGVAATLPLASTVLGQAFTCIRISATANACTVGRSGSDLIDGAASAVSLSAQWKSRTLRAISAGNWVTEAST